MSVASERDMARNERDRARDTLAKIRGIVVALTRGIGSHEGAIKSIAAILHVGEGNKRRGARPARRTP